MIPKRLLIPVGIVLLAFCLRMIALNLRPIWYDEAFSVLLAERDISGIIAGTAEDTMPPLYIVMLHYWLEIVGETPIALRMLSVSFSTLVVALLYVVGTRGVNRAVGQWAAFFSAAAPFQIYFGQELRMYSLLAFAGVLYIYGVMHLEKRSIVPIVLIAGSTAISIYSHNLAIFTLVSANVYLAWKRSWNTQARLLIAQSIGLLVSIPWLIYVPGQLEGIQRAYWTTSPGIVDIVQMLMMFTAYLPVPALVFAVALFVTFAVLTIGSLELLRILRRGEALTATLWLAFFTVPPALVLIVSYIVYPVFIPRGVIASSLAYYLLLGTVAARTPRGFRFASLALVAAIALGTLPFMYTYWGEWRRSPFREANQYLSDEVRPGDLVLHDNKLSYFPMSYYDRSLPQAFLADPPGSANDTLSRSSQKAMGRSAIDLADALESHSRLWFVIFQTALDQAAEDGHPHGNLSRLDAALTRDQVTAVGDLRIFLYERR